MPSPTEKTLNALLSSQLRIEKLLEKAATNKDGESSADESNIDNIALSISSNVEAMRSTLESVETAQWRAVDHLLEIENLLRHGDSGKGGKGGVVKIKAAGFIGLVTSALLFKLVGKKAGEEFVEFVQNFVNVFVRIAGIVGEMSMAGPAIWSATKGLAKSIVLLALITPLIALVTPFIPAIEAIARALAEVNKSVGSEEQAEYGKRTRNNFIMMAASMAIIGLALVGLGMLVFKFPIQIITGIGVMLLISGIFAIIGLAGPIIERGADAVKDIGYAIGIFGLGFLVAAGSLALASILLGGDGGLLMGVGMIVATIVGIGLAFALIGLAATFILEGALAIALMGIALIPFSLGVAVYAALIKDLSLKQVGLMALTLGGIGLAFIGIGYGSLFILPGILATVGMGLALYSLTWGMEAYV